MQIESFRVFRDLVEAASFSRAAEANGITQSAVSQQIRSIEKKFGARLIDRNHREFALTSEGEAFLTASREILDAYENLARRIESIPRAVSGPIRIATVFSIGLHEFPPYLNEFRRSHPAVDVKVTYCRSNEVYDAVGNGECDLGLVAYPARRPGLRTLTFWRDRLVLICPPSHPLAEEKRVRLSRLTGQKFVAFEPDLPTRKAIDKRLRQQRVKVKRILEFDNIEIVKRAVQVEQAISIVPSTTVRDEVRAGILIAKEIDEPEMWRPLGGLVRRDALQSPALANLLATLENSDLG
ncbi:MAG: LysR family transcriptional regulator [Chthoniobacterales bacterium]